MLQFVVNMLQFCQVFSIAYRAIVRKEYFVKTGAEIKKETTRTPIFIISYLFPTLSCGATFAGLRSG